MSLGDALLRIGADSDPEFLEYYPYPFFEIKDKSKNSRLMISLYKSNDPYIVLSDNIFTSRAVLGHTELHNKNTGSKEIRHASSLVMFDEKGNVIWSAP